MMRRVDKSALVFLALGVFIVLGTRKLHVGSFFRPGPGLFPLSLGIILILLSTISFFVSNPDKLPKLSWALFPRNVIYVIVLLFAYRFSLPFLGYSFSTLILFMFLLKVVAGQKWLPTMLWSVLITAISNVLFIQWLGVAFPKGLIPF